MCGLCYTLLCVICATQDGDAGAISSPFFRLRMRSGGLDRERGMSQRSIKKNAGNSRDFVFSFNTLTLISSLQDFYQL